jgi:hypothetical protein
MSELRVLIKDSYGSWDVIITDPSRDFAYYASASNTTSSRRRRHRLIAREIRAALDAHALTAASSGEGTRP